MRRRLNRKPKILFLYTTNAGVGYYRMHVFKEAMNRNKYASAVMPWYNFKDFDTVQWQFHCAPGPRGDWTLYHSRGELAHLVSQADIVVVEYLHSLGSLCLIEALKAYFKDKVFLTEIDDDIFNTPVYNDAFSQFRPGEDIRGIITEQLQALDGVIVTTPALKDVYSEVNDHVYVVPNCLDFELWDQVENRKTKDVRIGWFGGGNHVEDLALIEKPIKEFLENHDNVSFYVAGGVPNFFKNCSKIHAKELFEPVNKYPKKVAKLGFSIGIAPLVDNSFNRGKSNLRKLEYAGLKIPVVASNVGEFARTVKHGKDGFLFSNPEDFKKALHVLCVNKKLRESMGNYNYLDVKKNFNVDKIAENYTEILVEAWERGQTTKIDVSHQAERRGISKWTAGQPGLLSA